MKAGQRTAVHGRVEIGPSCSDSKAIFTPSIIAQRDNGVQGKNQRTYSTGSDIKNGKGTKVSHRVARVRYLEQTDIISTPVPHNHGEPYAVSVKSKERRRPLYKFSKCTLRILAVLICHDSRRVTILKAAIGKFVSLKASKNLRFLTTLTRLTTLMIA